LNNTINRVDPNGKDAIFVHFIKYRIDGIPGIGHAGVLLIDNKTGEAQYYDFGRYGKENKGLVRSNSSLGFVLDNIPINSKGVMDKDAISDRLKTISEKVGKNSEILGAYVESDKYEEMVSYANNKFDETNSKGSKDQYHEVLFNCATFASDVMKQDPGIKGAPDPFAFMPIHFTDWYQTSYPAVYQDDETKKYVIEGAQGADK